MSHKTGVSTTGFNKQEATCYRPPRGNCSNCAANTHNGRDAATPPGSSIFFLKSRWDSAASYPGRLKKFSKKVGTTRSLWYMMQSRSPLPSSGSVPLIATMAAPEHCTSAYIWIVQRSPERKMVGHKTRCTHQCYFRGGFS